MSRTIDFIERKYKKVLCYQLYIRYYNMKQTPKYLGFDTWMVCLQSKLSLEGNASFICFISDLMLRKDLT